MGVQYTRILRTYSGEVYDFSAEHDSYVQSLAALASTTDQRSRNNEYNIGKHSDKITYLYENVWMTYNFLGFHYIPTYNSFSEGNRSFSYNIENTYGVDSHAEGAETYSLGNYSHAEGYKTVAYSKYGHAEGNNTVVVGIGNHAEGNLTYVDGDYSHAEGVNNSSYNSYSHVEGHSNVSYSSIAHIEGYNNVSHSPYVAHVEGLDNIAYGSYTHIEGRANTTYGKVSHTEGKDNINKGHITHVEGHVNYAVRDYAHIEGQHSYAYSDTGHNEGWYTYTGVVVDDIVKMATNALPLKYNQVTHAEGIHTYAVSSGSHSEGVETLAYGLGAHSEGRDTKAVGNYSHAEGSYTTAYYAYSHAEGKNSYAGGKGSHAEGSSIAYGTYSHAEGDNTITNSNYAHAEGQNSIANGLVSHAEGNSTANGNYSHAEGKKTTTNEEGSHAEGVDTNALKTGSHAEGVNSYVYGIGAHGEGGFTYATSSYSHAEGYITNASGLASHAEGLKSNSVSAYSHAEGVNSYSIGLGSHAEGFKSIATGTYSHAEGLQTYTWGLGAHAEGCKSYAINSAAHAEGYESYAIENYSHAEGLYTEASGEYSHAEGSNTVASSEGAHAEGLRTESSGRYSHAEGSNVIASSEGAHAEGLRTQALGRVSHAEGLYTTARYDSTHAEGAYTYAKSDGAHAEGLYTCAYGMGSHAEGDRSMVIKDYGHAEGMYSVAYGKASHAEGIYSYSFGTASHAEGIGTYAYCNGSHVIGTYNIPNDNAISIIGIGSSTTNRKNAIEVLNNGFTYVVNVGGFNGTNVNEATSLQQTITNLNTSIDSLVTAYDAFNDQSTPFEIGYISVTGKDTTYFKVPLIYSTTYDSISEGIDTTRDVYGNKAWGVRSHAEGVNVTTYNEGEHAQGKMNNSTPNVTLSSIGFGYVDAGQRVYRNALETTVNGYTYLYGIGDYYGYLKEPSVTPKSLQEYLIEKDEATSDALNDIASRVPTINYTPYITAQYGKRIGTFEIIRGTGQSSTSQSITIYGPRDTAGHIYNDQSDSLAEGSNNITYTSNMANGSRAHAEGIGTNANAKASHTEGTGTSVNAENGHAEGQGCVVNGNNGHAEGAKSVAGKNSHAESDCTHAINTSHAEGVDTFAGNISHASGRATFATGESSHTEGMYNYASGRAAHAEGRGNLMDVFHDSDTDVVWFTFSSAIVDKSSSNYNKIIVTLPSAPSESVTPTILSKVTVVYFADANGGNTYVVPERIGVAPSYSSQNGYKFTISLPDGFEARQSMLAGMSKVKFVYVSNTASGEASHTEGSDTSATTSFSHAEGYGTKTTGNAVAAHVEGMYTEASGRASHASGYGTVANLSYMTAIGCYNKEASSVYRPVVFDVGFGTKENRNSIFTILATDDKTKTVPGPNAKALVSTTGEFQVTGKIKASDSVDAPNTAEVNVCNATSDSSLTGKIKIEDTREHIYYVYNASSSSSTTINIRNAINSAVTDGKIKYGTVNVSNVVFSASSSSTPISKGYTVKVSIRVQILTKKLRVQGPSSHLESTTSIPRAYAVAFVEIGPTWDTTSITPLVSDQFAETIIDGPQPYIPIGGFEIGNTIFNGGIFGNGVK